MENGVYWLHTIRKGRDDGRHPCGTHHGRRINDLAGMAGLYFGKERIWADMCFSGGNI